MTQTMFSKQFLSTLCLVGAAFIWGTAFVAQTTGMEYVGPLTFTNIRFIIGGLLVLPFALKEISKLQKVREKKKLLLIILATGLCLLLGSYLQQYALQYTKIGNAAFLTILYVPFVPIISRFVLKKRIHWSIWLSVSICLIGSYYLTINKKDIRNLKVSLKYNGPIVAPIQKDEKIANLVVTKKDEIIKSLPLYAAEDLKKVNMNLLDRL